MKSHYTTLQLQGCRSTHTWRGRSKTRLRHILMSLWLLSGLPLTAQLSSNPDKFLGNITTSGQVEYGAEKYHTLWNQLTPENESKWSSIEGSRRGSFNWWGCDNAYNYAKQHGFPFKFHTLIWGAQYPEWMNQLGTEEQYKAIVEWMDAIKERYPDLPMIDVVNEAVPGHQPAPYRAALGGEGKTGYDWIIKAFEMAHERWPNAILIYNDYNTFQWQRSQFIDLVRTLRDAGAPIDAYGCQSHDLTDMDVNSFKQAMTEIQNALKMPMYSTEYDIGTADDAKQLQRYKEQIPYMWEADYCAGITLWGYIYGRTWTTDGNSGIIRNGTDRPAMKWLREYMKSAKAQQAKSPFPGMKKEASVYVQPAALEALQNDALPIRVRAQLRTKTIDRVEVFIKGQLVETLTEAPYELRYTPTSTGKHDIKAVVVATDGSRYERLSGFTVYPPRAPYKTVINLPGTLQAENFDTGLDGISFHDSDRTNNGGANYRSNGGGIDIVSINTGYAVGQTAPDEWMEYTVQVKEAGLYSYDAYVASGEEGGVIDLCLSSPDGQTNLTGDISVPCLKPGVWTLYRAVHGRTQVALEAGQQTLRLRIRKGNAHIDRIVFRKVEVAPDLQVRMYTSENLAPVGEPSLLKIEATSATTDIKNVKVYLDKVLYKTLLSAPYEFTYTPAQRGTYHWTVIATDTQGKESEIATYDMLAGYPHQAFQEGVNVPGIIEAENFDMGGEGISFHDQDLVDDGKTKYRSDHEGVDIFALPDEGHAVGNTVADEWMEYTVNVTEAGRYTYEARVASGVIGGSFAIELMKDGVPTRLAKVNVLRTAIDKWDTYKVVRGSLLKPLEEGTHTLRFLVTGAGAHIDRVELKCVLPTGIEGIDAGEADAPAYNLQGIRVNDKYKGMVIRKGKKTIVN